MTIFRLLIVVAAFVAGCSSSRAPEAPRPEEAAPAQPGAPAVSGNEAAECRTDDECVESAYFDLEAAGGCCPATVGPSCAADVVTEAEAERRRTAWEAECAAVRCAPSTECPTGNWTPAPACRSGVCVDTARPAAD